MVLQLAFSRIIYMKRITSINGKEFYLPEFSVLESATKTCAHLPNLEEQLKDAGLQYKLMYFKDHPEIDET
jgi:hypothetical protein